MQLRTLNAGGMQEASRILDSIREGDESNVPQDFLRNDRYSTAVGKQVTRPKVGELPTRWHLGLWLYRLLEGAIPERDLFGDPGMWSWLAFFLFDTICPERDGARKLAEDAKYILSKGDYRKAYRHLVSGPYYMIRAHNESPADVRALLSNPPESPGDIYEQLASRKQIVTSAAAMRIANEMYWDARGGRVRRGAAGAGAGSARRYANVLMQYDVTHDIYAISAAHLRELLPPEFDRFLRS